MGLGLAGDALAQFLPSTSTRAIALVIHRNRAVVVAGCVGCLKGVAAGAVFRVAFSNLMAITKSVAGDIHAARNARATTGMALVQNCKRVLIIAGGTICLEGIAALTCLRVASADFMALIPGRACDALTQVFPSAVARPVTFIVHGNRALVIACRVRRLEGVTAHAGFGVALTSFMAIAKHMACDTLAA